MFVWGSMPPGIIILPVASIVRTPPGIVISLAGPTNLSKFHGIRCTSLRYKLFNFILNNSILNVDVRLEALVVIDNFSILNVDSILSTLQVYGHFFYRFRAGRHSFAASSTLGRLVYKILTDLIVL